MQNGIGTREQVEKYVMGEKRRHSASKKVSKGHFLIEVNQTPCTSVLVLWPAIVLRQVIRG